MNIKIDLRQAIFALSDALDLVGVVDIKHGKRVSFMALECGREMDLIDYSIDDLFHAAILHDCGVSSTVLHENLTSQLDLSEDTTHCDVGCELLEGFNPFSNIAPIIKYHHSHWDWLKKNEIPYPIAQAANLIFLVDRVDAHASLHYEDDLLLKKDEIRMKIKNLGGPVFNPEAMKIFLRVSDSDAFWMMLESRYYERLLTRLGTHQKPLMIDCNELKQLAIIFSRIVDSKSVFTLKHSLGVARLSKYLAVKTGLPVESVDKIEIAALLHDIGKLRVPDHILEKPGPLTDQESAVMRRHSFETFQILRRISGLEEIAKWASFHHEHIDGKGYPFKYNETKLSLEARIISVCDVFQALAQNRPYRASMPPEKIIGFLKEFVANGQLDREIVDVVDKNLQTCWRVAVGEENAV